MNVSIPTLRERVRLGTTTGAWPGHLARFLGKSQGDYDFVNEPRADFEQALDAAAADEVPLVSLIPSLDAPLWMDRYPHLYGWHLHFVLSLLAEARVGDPVAETRSGGAIAGDEVAGSWVVRGDLTVERGTLLVCGDLEVTGDLTLKGELRVCGSATIGGAWLDQDEYLPAVVVGDLTVGGRLLTRGQTFIGGHVRAAEVEVDNPGYVGFLLIGGDLDAARLHRVRSADDWITSVYGQERLRGT